MMHCYMAIFGCCCFCTSLNMIVLILYKKGRKLGHIHKSFTGSLENICVTEGLLWYIKVISTLVNNIKNKETFEFQID